MATAAARTQGQGDPLHDEIRELVDLSQALFDVLDAKVRSVGPANYPPRSVAAATLAGDIATPLYRLEWALRPDGFNVRTAFGDPRRVFEAKELIASAVDELFGLGFARGDLAVIPDVPPIVYSRLETAIGWLREIIGGGEKAAATEPTVDNSLAATIEKLDRLRRQGEAYTSQEDLAERLGVSAGQINRAINKGEGLRKWMDDARATKPMKSRRSAKPLNEITLDDMRESREADPADFMPPEDVEKILAKLVEEAEANGRAATLRAELAKMDPDGRRRLAQQYASADDLGENLYKKA